MTLGTHQHRLAYKGDDMDDVLEGIIVGKNQHKDEAKPKGEVDSLVQEAYDKAMVENHVDPSHLVMVNQETRQMSTEEEFKKIMSEPDPLAEGDIYAGEKKEEQAQVAINSEETEMESDIGDVLNRSFTHERNKNSLVQNIPKILSKKEDTEYNKMFTGLTANDIKSIDV